MEPERWQKIERLYHSALEREKSHRAAFVEQACGGDESLRQEVASLLAQAEGTGGFLEVPALEVAAKELASSGETLPGERIGPYRTLERIGQGGMGEVWLAEQEHPVRRRVALKLIKAGMDTRAVVRRFESERQALALMDHPAIAKVFDAGSTPQGRPYFAMEYVSGLPIATYCDQHKLTIRERLQLFVKVCEGVQHAHQKAIIHRDLKPSNILVGDVDGKPLPRIIDFGIAKVTSQGFTVETMTHIGAVMGTPGYMSPEQALSSGEDIDTRTDVYSLGVILYELLTGVLPIEPRKSTSDEFQRTLREVEPPKPSTKIRTQERTTSAELARKRQTEPLALAKQIRGDLDWIALKALEKDRSRRYASPSDLAADIGRYLNNEAVLEVPPSAAYQARKFARRHRAALATISAFMLVLVLAVAISIRQSVRANREAAVAQAVNDFLQDDLLAQASAARQSGPRVKPDPDLKVRTALDRAAVRIGGKFDQQPEVEAAIRDTIGQTYLDLGSYPEARTQLERALELRRRTLGAQNRETVKTISRLAYVAHLQGRNPEAVALYSQALEIQRPMLGTENRDTLYSTNGLASVYFDLGKYAQAEALFTETLNIQRRVLGPEHPDTLTSMHNLALAYEAQGKYAQAEVLSSQTLEARRRMLGPEHPYTLSSMESLAAIFYREGKHAQAEALDRQTLEIRRRVLGPEHPDTLSSLINLAGAYYVDGMYAQAEALNSQSLQIQRRLLGPEHPDTLNCMSNLAEVYKSEGKYAQAEALNSQALEARRRLLGPEHRNTLISMNNLADACYLRGKYAQAEALFNETLKISRRVLGPEHPLTLAFLSDCASMYQREAKYGLAEAMAAQALTGQRHTLGSEQTDTMSSAADLALAYLSQGKFAESEPLAREAFEFDRKQQPDDWQRFRAESLVGASLAGQKKYAEAEPLLLEGYQGLSARKERIAVPDRYHLDRAREWIVQLYQAWGQPAKAAEWKN